MSNKNLRGFVFLFILFFVTSCAKKEVIKRRPTYEEMGTASWYGPGFHGRKTACGERYDQTKLTAAHRKLPFGTKVKVTNLDNDKHVYVRINDRGPYAGRRVIDLSKRAARELEFLENGITKVKIEIWPKVEKEIEGEIEENQKLKKMKPEYGRIKVKAVRHWPSRHLNLDEEGV